METTNVKGWSGGQRVLHWLIAAAALSQLYVGFTFGDMARDNPERADLFAIHASLGLSIMVAMLLRLWWRLSHPVPPLPSTLRPIERRLARANHWAFYVLLIGLPIGGYLMVGAEGYRIPFYGTSLPPLTGENEGLADAIELIHVGGATVLSLLIILHVVAALRHEFLLRDNVLRRMLGFGLRPDS